MEYYKECCKYSWYYRYTTCRNTLRTSDLLYNPLSQWSKSRNNSQEARNMRANYRGKILAHLENENGSPKIDTTAMKYIHFGTRPQDNALKL